MKLPGLVESGRIQEICLRVNPLLDSSSCGHHFADQNALIFGADEYSPVISWIHLNRIDSDFAEVRRVQD